MSEPPAKKAKSQSGLAQTGLKKVALAERNMGALVKLRDRYVKELPFAGTKIGVNGA